MAKEEEIMSTRAREVGEGSVILPESDQEGIRRRDFEGGGGGGGGGYWLSEAINPRDNMKLFIV